GRSRSTACRHPLFSGPPRVQVVPTLQLRQSHADGLGVAAQDPRHRFGPAVPQLEGLDRRIPPPIVLLQGVEEALHLPFDFWCVGVHIAFPDGRVRSKGQLSYTNQTREVTYGLFLGGSARIPIVVGESRGCSQADDKWQGRGWAPQIEDLGPRTNKMPRRPMTR